MVESDSGGILNRAGLPRRGLPPALTGGLVGKPWEALWLMIEILHDFIIYQNIYQKPRELWGYMVYMMSCRIEIISSRGVLGESYVTRLELPALVFIIQSPLFCKFCIGFLGTYKKLGSGQLK